MMKTKKIAVILGLPIEYDTSAMLRCKCIIKGLRQAGNTVICFTPKPDAGDKNYNYEDDDVVRYGRPLVNGRKISEEINKRKSIVSIIKGILYRCYKKFDIFGASIINVPYKSFISHEIKKGDYDYLISFSDPLTAHFIGKYCKKQNKEIFYIQQWGDPLASDTIGKINLPVFIRKCIENSFLRDADRVCYVSPFTLEEQQKLFPRYAQKMIFTPTPSLFYGEDVNIKLIKKRLCIGYFGGYNSVARNILPFYSAAKSVQDIDFYIIGDSDIKLEGTENIKVFERIDKKELERYIRECDVLVCLMNIKGNQIPGKVYHDASLRKDILLIKDGEYGDRIQNFFEQYKHYTVVENKEESIKRTLRKYISEGVPLRMPVKDFEPMVISKKMINETT